MTSESSLVVEVFTDGACSGNPGPGGWGAVLRYGSKERELFGGEEDTTNNRMELTAVIRALDTLTRSVKVHVHTDSTYVQQGITRWIHGWKKNGWKTSSKEPVKNADLWQLLELSATRHVVHWHWVKGHSGHEGNERADALANKGVDSVRESRRLSVRRARYALPMIPSSPWSAQINPHVPQESRTTFPGP